MRCYSQILPFDVQDTVKNQFGGWLPVSVFRPERREEWREVVGDEGDEQARRSDDAQYLPGLRFSEFHPHLAEIVIRYWSMEGDLIIDPFAGRATRGVVALRLGRKYQGYEVAPSTFAKVSPKLKVLGGNLECADGCKMASTASESADLVFTCPPYHRLEKYESAADQLSDIENYKQFLERIWECICNVVRVLKPGKFCCWVCADWRDGKAFRLFHADCLDMFRQSILVPWDIVIVHNNSPFAPLQAAKVAAKRYTSKVHEYLLVFRKREI